jgi:hypothetical protein
VCRPFAPTTKSAGIYFLRKRRFPATLPPHFGFCFSERLKATSGPADIVYTHCQCREAAPLARLGPTRFALARAGLHKRCSFQAPVFIAVHQTQRRSKWSSIRLEFLSPAYLFVEFAIAAGTQRCGAVASADIFHFKWSIKVSAFDIYIL